MCGFVGIINSDPQNYFLNDTSILSMLNKISHRGPDGSNMWNQLPGFDFGFVRLSMVDYEKSNQPIMNEKGNLVLFFNGEIYNFDTLRIEMIEKGHHFSTNGDGEVILHLFEEYEFECLEHLDGMFAFCIIDINKRELFAARDPYGIKPLYYSQESNRFLIASVMKSILAARKSKPSLDNSALSMYLNLRFIPSPYTIFNNIQKLEPGTFLLTNGTTTKVKRYHLQNKQYDPVSKSLLYTTFTDDIKEMNSKSTQIGCFLSGGIDSSLIANIASKTNTLKAFTVGYDNDFEFDESIIANKIANDIGAQHFTEKITKDNLINLLNLSIYHLDEPFYSSVSVSTLKLAQMASNHVKGVFTGDGSDELFFGYYYLRKALEYESKTDILDYYVNGLGWLKNVNTLELFNGISIGKDELYHIIFNGCEMNDIAETLRRVEVYKRLPDYHLKRIDKLTMACGIEARVPFLRKNIVNTALSYPYSDLMNNDDPKRFLKDTFNNFMTPNIQCTRKQPFTSPIKLWIEEILWDDVYEIFNDNSLLFTCQLNRKVLQNIINSYKGLPNQVNNLWGIYMLLKWAKCYT